MLGRSGTVTAALLILFAAVLAGCGTDVNGYWDAYRTESGGSEEGPFYLSLAQDGDAVTGSVLCENSVQIAGEVKDSDVELSWTEEDGTMLELSGSIDGDFMNGTMTLVDSSGDSTDGTWWAVQRTSTPDCDAEVEVRTLTHYPDDYNLLINITGVDVPTISSVAVEGDNISAVGDLASNGDLVVSLTAKPAVGDAYTVTITYEDSSTEEKQDSVSGVNESFAFVSSPADGSVVGSTTPTFSWTEASDVSYTRVEVYPEGSSTNIWDYVAYPGTSSVAYDSDGTAASALSSGSGYTLYLCTVDSSANVACTDSTFTVQ